MATLLPAQYKTTIARNIKDSFSNDSYYMFLGKTTAWDTETSPDTLTESDTDLVGVANNIFAIKKISSSNSCLLVDRINWTSSTIYDQYDVDDENLYSKSFYVLTSDMNVYKCLNNNSGAASTVMPTGQSTSAIQTGDGYTWKFMYDLSSSIQTNFLTDDYLPVPTGTQKTAAQTLVENAAVYVSGGPLGGHGYSAAEELKATSIGIYQQFRETESGVIDATVTYREVGIVKNPTLISTGTTATGAVYSVNDSNSNINITDAQVIYVDTRTPIQRATDLSETVFLVITIG